ncbi:MAG: glycosyltransferase [Candidatus Bathyarchaeales archaeon]
MKVAIFHPSLNRGGGAERVCLTTIKALMNAGHNVKLITVDKVDWRLLEKRFGEFLKPIEEIYFFDGLPGRGWYSQTAFMVPSFVANIFSSKLEDFDITFNTGGELFASITDISYVNALPVKIMRFYSDSGYPNFFGFRFASQIYDLFSDVINSFLKSNLLLVNSIFLKKIIQRHFNGDVLVVYPPVDVRKLLNFGKRMRCREDVVVSVSRLRSGKNLEIIPKIAEKVEKGKFLIFGSADQASSEVIARLTRVIDSLNVGGRVRLFVNEPFEKLWETISSAKIFLHTQFTEAFGMSVVEGMAAGCVPVVPRCGGPWFDILECKQGVYGFSYRNVEEAADLINTLLSDEGLRVDVAARAAERAKSFDSAVFERKILDIVAKVFKAKFG